MGRTVTIDNSMLAQLAVNPTVTAAFPFLAAPFKQPAKKSCCGGSTPAVSWGQLSLGLLGLPPDRRTVFKALINADTVVVYVNGTAKSF